MLTQEQIERAIEAIEVEKLDAIKTSNLGRLIELQNAKLALAMMLVDLLKKAA